VYITLRRITLLLLVGLATIAQLNTARAQIRVACCGDSITYGVNLSGAGTATGQTWPGILAAALGSGYNVQNYGYPGLSLMSLPGGNPGSHPAYTSTSYYTSSISFNPNYVFIMLGTNDASFTPNSGQTWVQTYESLYISQYESLIQAYQNCPAHPKVFVVIPVRVAGTNQYGIDPTILNSVVVPTTCLIAQVTTSPTCNFFAASSPYGNEYQDNVHPQAVLAATLGTAAYTSLSTYISSPPAAPAAPTGLTAAAGNNTAQLEWTTPTSGWVTSYNIYRGTTAGGESTIPIATGAPGYMSNYVDWSATDGATYYYKVATVNSAGASAMSSEVHVTPGTGLYDGLPYVSSTTPATIFADNFDLGGQGLAYGTASAGWGPQYNQGGFYRFYDGVGIEQNTDTTSNGYDVGWSNPGTWINYTVNVATAGTYITSFRLASGATGGGTLHLQNTAGTNISGEITCPDTGGWETWSTVTASMTLPAGVQTFTLIEDSGSYNVNYISLSLPSAPAAPTGLTAVPGNAQVSLSWNSSSQATSYNVYRSTTSGGEGSTAIASGITTTNFTNSGLTNGTTYYYKVAAVNSIGTSPQSSEASAKPSAAGPIANGTYTMTPQNATTENVDATNGSTTSGTQLQIWAATPGDVNQEWIFTNEGGGYYLIEPSYDTALAMGVAGNSSANGTAVNLLTNNGATGELWYLTAATGGYTLAPACASGSTLNVTGNGTVNGTLLQIWAANGATNTIFALNAPAAPAAPTGLTATTGNAQVALSWTASSGAASYNIYRGTSAGGESTTAIATEVTTTTYTNTGLTNGTAYYYKVAAVDSTGTSGYSNEASATPQVPAPSAPTGLTATAGNAQVALAWTASSGATSYNVYRGTTTGGESTTAIATGITTTSYTNTGLTNGSTYFYKVVAVNTGGTSGYSNEASATPSTGSGPIANGTYTLTPQNATTSRVDATNGSTTSGTQIQIWADAPGNVNQQWIFTNEGGGYYKIQPSYDTSLALGISTVANGAAVQMLTDNGGTNERWLLTSATGGYTFTPENATGYTMNVSGPSSANGTLIQIWTATGGTNTIFAFGSN